ncbi:PAS domain-containing sensor histidine kinase [Terrimonas alba]|uniref:PAS domain-containing sensor histidine kinase n=1 Tax=Terrimonas alba TaxID=3349636 RepID=UPI0035F4ACA4
MRTENHRSGSRTRSKQVLNADGNIFPAILNTLKEPLFLFDDKFKMAWHNKACNELYQYVSGKQLDRNFDFNELLTIEQQLVFRDYLEKALGGEQAHFEWKYMQSITKWLSVSLYPFIADNGAVVGICGSLRDITERKKSYEIIRENEEKYRTLVESLNEGVILQTLDKKVLTVNKSAELILDLPADELMDKGFPYPGWKLLDENEKEIPGERLFYKKNGKINTVKSKNFGLQKTDHIQWLRVSISCVRNSQNNEPYAHVISFEDITEQKRISKEMEVLSLIARETTNGIIIFDKASSEILWINEGFTRLTGFPAKDVIGENPVRLLQGPETDQHTLKYMSRQIQNNLSYNGDLLIYAKDGSKRLHNVTGQPIKDANGFVTKYFAISTDITERHRLEEERLQKEIEQQKEISRVTLQAREAERNELGRELHDNINQILATVKLQLSHCLANYKTGKPVIVNSLKNIQEAMGEIRRLSHKMVMPRFSESCLKEKLQGLIANYTYQQTIELVAKEWDDKGMPPAIKETFFRIAQEQLSNIQKHAKANKVVVHIKNDPGAVAMSIEDNGIGFNTRQKRNGIGLTNIINRVESYNGAAQFISAPGKGCILSVTIPLPRA